MGWFDKAVKIATAPITKPIEIVNKGAAAVGLPNLPGTEVVKKIGNIDITKPGQSGEDIFNALNAELKSNIDKGKSAATTVGNTVGNNAKATWGAIKDPIGTIKNPKAAAGKFANPMNGGKPIYTTPTANIPSAATMAQQAAGAGTGTNAGIAGGVTTPGGGGTDAIKDAVTGAVSGSGFLPDLSKLDPSQILDELSKLDPSKLKDVITGGGSVKDILTGLGAKVGVLADYSKENEEMGRVTAEEAAKNESIRNKMLSDYAAYEASGRAADTDLENDQRRQDIGYDEKVRQNASQAQAIENQQAQYADSLRDETTQNANRVDSAYGSMMPKLQSNMENAMSLRDAQDANNSVARGMRDLYNTEGTAQEQIYGKYGGNYDREIRGTQTRGRADAGILSALGAQSAARFGGPQTGSQRAAAAAQGSMRAGEAMASARQRMQGLEDQRRLADQQFGRELRGLRTEGLGAGQRASDAAYARGQAALSDYEGANINRARIGSEMRGERAAYDDKAAGLRQSGVTRQGEINRGQYSRDLGRSEDRYGRGQARSAEGQNFRSQMDVAGKEDFANMSAQRRQELLTKMVQKGTEADIIRGSLFPSMNSVASAASIAGSMRNNQPAKKATPQQPSRYDDEESTNVPNARTTGTYRYY
jgi:hypothetical protein